MKYFSVRNRLYYNLKMYYSESAEILMRVSWLFKDLGKEIKLIINLNK